MKFDATTGILAELDAARAEVARLRKALKAERAEHLRTMIRAMQETSSGNNDLWTALEIAQEGGHEPTIIGIAALMLLRLDPDAALRAALTPETPHD